MLMSLYPEYDDIARDIIHDKANLRIGIFGSFEETRKPFLNSLKGHLRSNGYKKTYIASDCPYQQYDTKDRKYEIALENSEGLLCTSQVRVFIIFYENDGEHGINESALIEIAFLYKSNCEDGVIIIFEDKAKEQIHANLKGILSKGRKLNWAELSLDPTSKLYEDMVESECYNYIGRQAKKQKEYSVS